MFILQFYKFCVFFLLLSFSSCTSPILPRFFQSKTETELNNQPKEAVSKKAKEMSLAEAREARIYFEWSEDTSLLIPVLERIRALSRDKEELREVLLAIADTHEKIKSYEKAQKSYAEYVSLYPGSTEARRASAQEIFTSFKQMRDCERDQELTHSTLKASKTFLKTYPKDREYIAEIKNIIDICYQNLFNHEVQVFEFYVSKKNWAYNSSYIKAAEGRLAYVQKHYEPHIKNGKQKIQELELKLSQIKLAQAINKKDLRAA